MAHYLSEDSLGGDQSLWDVQMGFLGLTSTIQSLREMGGKGFFSTRGYFKAKCELLWCPNESSGVCSQKTKSTGLTSEEEGTGTLQ